MTLLYTGSENQRPRYLRVVCTVNVDLCGRDGSYRVGLADSGEPHDDVGGRDRAGSDEVEVANDALSNLTAGAACRLSRLDDGLIRNVDIERQAQR